MTRVQQSLNRPPLMNLLRMVSMTQMPHPPREQTLDQQIAAILGPDPKVAELQGQVDALRAEQHRAQEMQAFNSFADDLQKRMPPHVPDDYAVTKLKALAHDPTIALAFDYRNVNKAAANVELAKVQVALSQLQRTPGSDPNQIAQLQDYGQRLEIAVHSASILRKASLDIIREAEKLPPPIDPDATQIRNDVAWAVKGASAKRIADPPPDLGKMTENEFREYKKQFGF
jgi:hypothetical protein